MATILGAEADVVVCCGGIAAVVFEGCFVGLRCRSSERDRSFVDSITVGKRMS